MRSVNMLEAKSSLSRLVDAIERGEEQEIFIARNGKPAAKLVALDVLPAAMLRVSEPVPAYGSASQSLSQTVTFKVDDKTLADAQAAALAANTSLDEQFKQWIEQQARNRQAQRTAAALADLQALIDTSGVKFSREDMNERR